MPLSFEELRDAERMNAKAHHAPSALSPLRNVRLAPLGPSPLGSFSPTSMRRNAEGASRSLSPLPTHRPHLDQLTSSSPTPAMVRTVNPHQDVASITAASRELIYQKTIEDQKAVLVNGRERLKGKLATRGIPFVRHQTTANNSDRRRMPPPPAVANLSAFLFTSSPDEDRSTDSGDDDTVKGGNNSYGLPSLTSKPASPLPTSRSLPPGASAAEPPSPDNLIASTLAAAERLRLEATNAGQLMANYRNLMAEKAKQHERRTKAVREQSGSGDEMEESLSEMSPTSPQAIARATAIAHEELMKRVRFKGAISSPFLEVVQRRNESIQKKTRALEAKEAARAAEEALLNGDSMNATLGGPPRVSISSPVPFGVSTQTVKPKPLALLKSTELVREDDAPFFVSERQWKEIPRGLVSERLHELKSDPTAWFSFTDQVAATRSALRKKQSEEQDNIVGRNKLAAHTSQLATVRKRDAAATRNLLHETKVELAKQVVDQRMVDVLVAIDDREKRRSDRQLERKRRLLAMSVLGTIAYKFCRAVLLDRNVSLDSRKLRAARVFAYYWRKKKGRMTHVRAFCIRARFLKRALTRIRVRIIRPRHVDRIGHLLGNLTVYHKLLGLLRELRVQAIRCQRLWRSRVATKQFQGQLRTLQFDNALTQRTADSVVALSRLRQAEALDSLRENHNGASKNGSRQDVPTTALISPASSQWEQEVSELRRVTPSIRDVVLADFHQRQEEEFKQHWTARYVAIKARADGAIEPIPPKVFWKPLIKGADLVDLLAEARRALRSGELATVGTLGNPPDTAM